MKRAVTYSELRERRRCPWRAHLAYDRRLSPIVESAGLREGSIFDAGWNALYEHFRETGAYSVQAMCAAMLKEYEAQLAALESKVVVMDEERAAMQERIEELLNMAHYFVRWASTDGPAYDEVVTTQYEGRVPLTAPSGRSSSRYDLRFKVDGIVAIDGRLWIEERKAWKSIDQASLRMLQLDEQCGMYLWALRRALVHYCDRVPKLIREAVVKYGLPVGVHYVILRKKLPAVPALLKDGSTSRDKRIDTDYETYHRTLIERGQDPADYAEVLDALRAKGNTFVHRELVLRNEAELEEIGRRIWEAARFAAEGHTFKSPNRSCAWECPYFALCLEWSDEVAQMHFRVRERTHEEYEEMEEAA